MNGVIPKRVGGGGIGQKVGAIRRVPLPDCYDIATARWAYFNVTFLTDQRNANLACKCKSMNKTSPVRQGTQGRLSVTSALRSTNLRFRVSNFNQFHLPMRLRYVSDQDQIQALMLPLQKLSSAIFAAS